MKAIEVNGLCFAYGTSKDVLRDVSFTIEAGQYVSIIGHNGSGKSTLAKHIMGLLTPKSGVIKVFDETLNNKTITSIREKIGIVFQNPDNQFISSTVEDDIAFGLENRNISHDEMKDIVVEFATKVGMGQFLDKELSSLFPVYIKEPSQLSGGQKQRVAIAGVLAKHPSIVIFDESTSMLDPKGRREIRELILKMREENKNLTILSITHDVEEAYQSDYVLVMNDGCIILSGTPNEVFANENTIRNVDLSLPTVLELKNKFIKKGIDCSSSQTLEQLVKKVCQ